MTHDPTALAFAAITAGVDKDLMKDYPQPATPPLVSATMFTPREETAMPTIATLKAADVKRNGFTENLGKDEYVATDDAGNVLARSDRATLERDYPNAHFFGAKDLGGNAAASKTRPENDVPAAPVPDIAGVPQTPSGHPVADALADDPTPEPGTRTHPLDDGTPYEGPAAVEPTDPALNQIANAKGTPIKDALKASADASTEAENAGRHAKTDELQAEQAKALEKDNVDLNRKTDRKRKPSGKK